MDIRTDFRILLLVLVLQGFCSIPSQALVSITKAECIGLDLNHCYFKHCEMKTDEKGHTFMHFHVAMRDKRPVNDVTVNVILFKISKTYRIPLFDESLDFCAFMGDTAVAKMLSFINKQFMKLTNANHSCPYQHDIIYYGTKNEQFLTEIPAPKGNYILQMKVAANKKWKAHVKFFATVY